ncbi:hypothetical protein CQW23_18072 [Capsicum baccatum]|uniref:F-box/LRR-repeat protein 15-like leucin rich repeat domain-containing protein n=1 Tax=Capsicum baccatum TaxID=33114 RepID=A0A2G2WFM4_CAPBA|nr:hypothetical protein CQW23_18072 [Capsicum baccatum]
MDETAKRHCTGEVGGSSGGVKGGGSSDGNFEPSMGRFTDHIIIDGFYLDEENLKHVVRRVPGAKSLTIECLRMRNDSSIINILGEHIEDLSLLKCTHLSYDILRAIGERCPQLKGLEGVHHLH